MLAHGLRPPRQLNGQRHKIFSWHVRKMPSRGNQSSAITSDRRRACTMSYGEGGKEFGGGGGIVVSLFEKLPSHGRSNIRRIGRLGDKGVNYWDRIWKGWCVDQTVVASRGWIEVHHHLLVGESGVRNEAIENRLGSTDTTAA